MNRSYSSLVILITIHAFIIITASIVSGSTIVGIRTPENIVIAADSKVTVWRTNSTIYIPGCKIFNIRNAGFAMAGFVTDRHRGIFLGKAVAEILRNRKTITETTIQIEWTIKKILKKKSK
jgi:20S proteasome alpha/beta subunit